MAAEIVKIIKNQDIPDLVSFIFSPLTGHPPLSTPERVEREVALRQKIEHLKRNKAAICHPKSSKTTAKDSTRGVDGKKEKTSLLYEFISVRVGPSGFCIRSNDTLQYQRSHIRRSHMI